LPFPKFILTNAENFFAGFGVTKIQPREGGESLNGFYEKTFAQVGEVPLFVLL